MTNTEVATTDRITDDGEIISGLPAAYTSGNQSLAVNLARAEIDQQIATARAMPRGLKRVIDNILTLATLDVESAEECVYALPRGGKPIRGPSVRLAEIVASQWGNCRVGARIVHVDRFEKFVEAEGVFHDLETNTAVTARVRRRISTRAGKVFDDDMIVVTGNAACAIAKRNAILGGVPKGVWRKAYQAVEAVLAGDVKTLAERREKALKAFAAFGVKPEQVFSALGVAGLDEVGIDHITTLMGMHSALKSGESTVEEMFPRQQAPGERPQGLAGKLDALAAGPALAEDGVVQEAQPTADAGDIPAALDRRRAVPEPQATATQAEREPGEDDAGPAEDAATGEPGADADPVLDGLQAKAMQGVGPFEAAWRRTSAADQKRLQPEHAGLLDAARQADSA